LARRLRRTTFAHLSIDDPFFDSLKEGYEEFSNWFARKADEPLYVVDDDNELSGMIYLKLEYGVVSDVEPALPDQKWLKVGTLKIVGRGTKLGERVLKKIFDTAIAENADGIYITVFDVHEDLLNLFQRYGFRRAAIKRTRNGTEIVLTRLFDNTLGDIVSDYPLIKTLNRKFWLLAVYPEYHSQLLPDSILNNESREILEDVSHTNTIHKMYIGRLALTRMSPGDAVVLYRTSDNQGPAYYRSVATSICVVEQVKGKRDFTSATDFVEYAKIQSVFSEDDLRDKFTAWDRLYTAKMTYNVAFTRRLTRGYLLDDLGISEQPRWDLRELTSAQFRSIAQAGNVNARYFID